MFEINRASGKIYNSSGDINLGFVLYYLFLLQIEENVILFLGVLLYCSSFEAVLKVFFAIHSC